MVLKIIRLIRCYCYVLSDSQNSQVLWILLNEISQNVRILTVWQNVTIAPDQPKWNLKYTSIHKNYFWKCQTKFSDITYKREDFSLKNVRWTHYTSHILWSAKEFHSVSENCGKHRTWKNHVTVWYLFIFRKSTILLDYYFFTVCLTLVLCISKHIQYLTWDISWYWVSKILDPVALIHFGILVLLGPDHVQLSKVFCET